MSTTPAAQGHQQVCCSRWLRQSMTESVNDGRYDSLYDVVDSKLCNEGTAMYRFQLKQKAHQGPIRFERPAMRPTGEGLKELFRAFNA
ncbi:MAG: hypothetical protein Q9174_006403 [Haloplaca sp. 1 TL-2023]